MYDFVEQIYGREDRVAGVQWPRGRETLVDGAGNGRKIWTIYGENGRRESEDEGTGDR